MSSLALTLLYLLAAVLGVVTCRSLKLPPMLGYLAAGVLIGPHALALAQNSEGVRHLGEFGVVFLMFAIGLEFRRVLFRSQRGGGGSHAGILSTGHAGRAVQPPDRKSVV